MKLISKGDGGLNELADELNSGKIMYAFVSVQDIKTSLTKFLLINWQVSEFQFSNIFVVSTYITNGNILGYFNAKQKKQ